MKRILAAVCSLALCSAPALAKGKAAHAAMTDQQFVNFAAQTDMVESNLGKLAQNVAVSQQVKDYGQMLTTDHEADLQQLKQVAGQLGLSVPDAIDAENNRTVIGPFHKLNGAEFDRRFIPAMVSGHTKAVALYKKEAAELQSAALKSYAQDALPVLEKHLDAAKALEKGKAK
jgi:putative membrane protein